MAARYRYSQQSPSIWPGYVDALSALLMVVIFVLMIFTFSQFILSYILSGQNTELQSLHARIAEITELLGLERNRNEQMGKQIASLSSQVEILTLDRTKLRGEVDDLTAQNETQKEEKKQQLRTIASLQQDINALQTLRRELEQKIAEAAAGLEREQQLTMSLRDRSKALEASLADEQEKTLLAQQNIEQRDIRIQALSALIGEQQQSLDKEQRLTADARAEVALLKEQLAQLHSQLEEINTCPELRPRRSGPSSRKKSVTSVIASISSWPGKLTNWSVTAPISSAGCGRLSETIRLSVSKATGFCSRPNCFSPPGRPSWENKGRCS